MQEKFHDEFLTEPYVMSLFGLDPNDKKSIEALQYLRNQKGMPHCAVSQKYRVYPRAELSAWLMSYLKPKSNTKEYTMKKED